MKNRLLAKQQNKGSAMIVAIAASMITMVLALSLLLLSYSLFNSVVNESGKMQCKEMAYSFSQELANEITTSYEDYAQQKAAFQAGNNPLWFFVRYHIWQENGDWPYYNEDENQHKKPSAYRYFKLKSSNGEINKCADQILVTMYWDGSLDTQNARFKEGTVLHVKVEAFKGDAYFANNMTFGLEITDYGDVADGTTDKNGELVIDAKEKWKWVRE